MSKFFAFIYRMKYIARWSLMRNTRTENVAEHSFHVSVLAHALAVIARDVFGRNIDPGAVAAAALYHDMPEILTGDLPTPIKYYGSDIKNAYKRIEREATETLLSNLTDEMRPGISEVAATENPETEMLVKAADKFSALIKCMEEKKAGNKEFDSAFKTTEASIKAMELPEADCFMEEFIPAYNKNLDELQKR